MSLIRREWIRIFGWFHCNNGISTRADTHTHTQCKWKVYIIALKIAQQWKINWMNKLPAKRPYFWNIRSTSVFEHWNVFKFPTKTREFTACGSCEFVWFDNFDIFIMNTVFVAVFTAACLINRPVCGLLRLMTMLCSFVMAHPFQASPFAFVRLAWVCCWEWATQKFLWKLKKKNIFYFSG